jgi:16S rRNA C967 or C1407 C5-methylase (RsmB/RsmF family)/NOL1/NOP2/fmu family ribosome biogenesis protein
MTEDQFPQAFKKREQAYLGDQWDDFVKAHLQPSPISIRVNPCKGENEDSKPHIPWTQYGRYLVDRPSFTLDPTFHAGKYYVQEASSMFLEQAFMQTTKGTTGLNVLDLCAAPGGKSTHLLSLMDQNSLLVSNEVIQSRSAILSENLQKWGHSNVVVTNNDPKDFQRLPGFFDVIVVDAPCSGEGLFRKDPEAIMEWSEDAVALCSRRQRRILNDVWPALRTGGILIYSTCTYNAQENEENLRWLQQEHEVESIPLDIKDEWGLHIVNDNNLIGYRFFPHRVKGEGFFLAALRKIGRQSEGKLNSRSSLAQPSKKIKDQLSEWTLRAEQTSFIIRNDRVQFFPKSKDREVESLVKNLRIVLAGTFIATVKHDKLVPEHSFALSMALNRDFFKTISLTRDEALQYLRKDAMSLSFDQKGFALVSFENIPIGWVNVLESRINNLYPSEWRIRMR